MPRRFTYYTSNPFSFTPPDISGLDLWFDSTDQTTINSGSPTDGVRVTNWNDKSTSLNHLTQTTIVNQPTWNSSGSLTFANPNQLVFTTNSVPTNATWFIVLNPADTSSNQVIYFRENSSTRTSVGHGGIYAASSAGTVRKGQPLALGLQLISATQDKITPAVEEWKNQVPATGSSSNTFSGGVGAVLSGRSGNPALNAFNGDIFEIIRYNSILSATDRNTVEDYLNNKYGIF